MRVWVDIDEYPVVGIADAEKETAVYSRTAREMDLSELGLTEEEFYEVQKITESFLEWQEKLLDALKRK